MATEKGTRRASSAPPASVGICHLEPVSPLSAQPGPPAPASPPHLAGAGGGGRAPPPPPPPRPGPCAGLRGSRADGRSGRGRGPSGRGPRAGPRWGGSRGGQRAASPRPGLSSAWLCVGASAKVAREAEEGREEPGEGRGTGAGAAAERERASERARRADSARNRAPMARMRGGEGRA